MVTVGTTGTAGATGVGVGMGPSPAGELPPHPKAFAAIAMVTSKEKSFSAPLSRTNPD